jgi:hypothetical protein
VALAIAALVVTFVSASNSSVVVHSGAANRMMVAALLMHGVVLDIEEEYKVDGFPTNDLEGRDCEIPSPYDDLYRCEYSLKGLDIDPGTLSEMASGTLNEMFGGGAMGGGDDGVGGGGGGGGDGGVDNAALLGKMQGLMGGGAGTALALLLDPLQGPILQQICRVNPQQAIQNAMMSAGFLPLVVQKASEVTRKLTVTLSWEDIGPKARQEIVVETFVVAIPEDQEEFMKTMGRAEDAGLLDGAVPGAQPGNQPPVPPPANPGGGR